MKKTFYFIMLSLLLTAMSGGCAGGGSGGGTDDDTSVTFSGVTQAGGTSGTADTTSLTLTFSVDPTTLTADDITVTGAAKGALTGTGTTRTLAISDITAADGATVSVEIEDPAISGSPQTAVVYRLLTIGMDYLGGKIAYFFVSGDTGYVPGETHGLIAAVADQALMIPWAIDTNSLGTTSTDIGTGPANTNAIVDQSDPSHSGLTSYAAGVCAANEGEGYTDWYLPSKSELGKLYASKDLVGGYADYSYWSSSEYAGNGAWGWRFKPDGTGVAFILNKTDNIHVRAVRTF